MLVWALLALARSRTRSRPGPPGPGEGSTRRQPIVLGFRLGQELGKHRLALGAAPPALAGPRLPPAPPLAPVVLRNIGFVIQGPEITELAAAEEVLARPVCRIEAGLGRSTGKPQQLVASLHRHHL